MFDNGKKASGIAVIAFYYISPEVMIHNFFDRNMSKLEKERIQ
ncbi:hypothetical protein HMPREF9372_0518 [Sporosarcina newyorkensis 2681]|uniref:Uncharacterized protein n=1 Tax=Sporosarcina newyorkensis 2681 TaxID=1027292 RepID=F9DNY8_9BACL|nr:hypothetical protein HMPREF9372_0518 [Sporosarcina newyorkensis 2681]